MGAHTTLPLRSLLARRPLRHAVRRQPVLFWLLAFAAAGATYLTVDTALARTTEGAAVYGRLVPVAVATRDLDVGEVISGGDVEVADLPSRLVPADALTDLPVGRSVRSPVVDGEALVASRLAPEGSIGVASTLDAGERAIAIPTPAHRAPIEVGQRVDVLATVDPSMVPGRSPTSVVAEAARVLDVTETGITVAVSVTTADRVATALASAVVSVVVAPG
ncbi:MAG: flagella basal body P-ring formation protein FlgA [Acidimicrobiia bacterium]|nr:flagella basal body P-ring formation protein FlgA [Acidimicrobiia bacterium]